MPISGCAINQPCVDMQEMNPYFVVATLVGTFDSKSFVRDFECTVHATVPLSFGTRWQDETAHIEPLSWNPTWSHKTVGPCGIGKSVLANASSTVLSCRCSLPDRRRRGTIEVTSHRVDLLLTHHSTDCKQQVLRDSAFLGMCVVGVERHHGEVGFTIARDAQEGGM